jgi:hypothetical protein
MIRDLLDDFSATPSPSPWSRRNSLGNVATQAQLSAQ